jgi:hypothetical protein
LITTAISAVGTTNDIKKEESLLMSGPTIEWMNTYGGEQFDQFRCVQQTSDLGYIAFGEYEESDMNYGRLMKLDSNGIEVWSVINYNINGSSYSGPSELMNHIIQTSDGGYLACGISEYYFTEAGGWANCGFLWKTDSVGATEWLKFYYDVEEILILFIYEIEEVADGYIGGGSTIDYLDMNLTEYTHDFMIQKVDFNGDLVWYKSYELGGYEIGISFDITYDGYYLSGLYSVDETFNNDDDEYAMLVTDSDGNELWHNTYGGDKVEYSPTRGCGQTPEGGYTMCGFTESYTAQGGGNWDIWQIKTDSSGNMEWENLFGGTGYENCWSMCRTSDGIVMAIAYNLGSAMGTRDDLLLVKTCYNGNIIVNFLFEESGRQIPIYIAETDDGGFIICGRTGNPDSPATDSLLIKISAFDNQRPDKPDTPIGPTKGSPGVEYTFTTSGSDPDGDDITYRWDWDDGTISDWLNTTEASHTWDVKDNYDIRVKTKDEHGGESDWSDAHTIAIPRNKIVNKPLLQFLQCHPNLFPTIQKILQILGL